jgi:hypothetical protein
MGQGVRSVQEGHPVPELPNKELLLADEVADLFRVSRGTITNWVRDPDKPLKGFRIGRSWLFPRWQVVLMADLLDEAKADR